MKPESRTVYWEVFEVNSEPNSTLFALFDVTSARNSHVFVMIVRFIEC